MNDNPIRVLIIEDDIDQAGIIGSYLADGAEGLGAFALTQAPRLSTAYRLLARWDYDVILIDLVLPQSVGLEGFLKIRAMKPATPIIILTGLRDETLAIQAVKLGGQDYLVKGSPDCCLLKRAIHYAIEKKRLSNIIEELLGADQNAKQSLSFTPSEIIDKPFHYSESHGMPKTSEDTLKMHNSTALEQLKRLQEEIRKGLRVLEVRNNFMNRISHELRNTLAAMKTAAHCLREEVTDSLTPRQSRMVDIISHNVDRQIRIIDNVLDLANFRSGKFKIQFRSINITEIIHEVVQEFVLLDTSHKLQVDIDSSISLIKGDPDLIAQVLRNLISNALRFAKEKIIVKASKAEPKGIFISITDDGNGIEPKRIGELFTEFVQLSQPASENVHKGTGLGLTICKEIVSGHHGKIWAENAPGQGARFSFLLPMNETLEKAIDENDRSLVGSGGTKNTYHTNGQKHSH